MHDQRASNGFLSSEALRSGARDQYAVTRSYGTVVVELSHDIGQMPWRVSVRITKGDERTSTDRAFSTLDEARRAFRGQVRKHP